MLPDGRLQQPTRLGAVVADALRRWYLETEKEAMRGDVVSTRGPCGSGMVGLEARVVRWGLPLARQPSLPALSLSERVVQPYVRPVRPAIACCCQQAPAGSHAAATCLACCPPLQKAQALLGQMLIEGYGCEADPARGREWAEKARRRGYRMDGAHWGDEHA